MAMITVPASHTQAAASTVLACVKRHIESATEDQSHVISARNITVCLVVAEDVPLDTFAKIEAEVAALPSFPFSVGQIRWTCRCDGRAGLEIDLQNLSTGKRTRDPSADADARDTIAPSAQPPLRLTMGGGEHKEEGGMDGESKGRWSLMTLGKHTGATVRRWFDITRNRLVKDLLMVDTAFLQDLDTCRIPRIRAKAIHDTALCIEHTMDNSLRTAARDPYVINLGALDESRLSPCTCIVFSTHGVLALVVNELRHRLPDIAERCEDFYTVSVALTASSVTFTLAYKHCAHE